VELENEELKAQVKMGVRLMEQVAGLQDDVKLIKGKSGLLPGAKAAHTNNPFLASSPDGTPEAKPPGAGFESGSEQLDFILERIQTMETGFTSTNQTLGSVSNVSRKLVETVARHDKDVQDLKKGLRSHTEKLSNTCNGLENSMEAGLT